MKKIDVVSRKTIWLGIAAFFVVLSLIFIFTRGFNLGVEFVGGSEILVRAEGNMVEQDLRQALNEVSSDFATARVTRVRSVGDPAGVVKFSVTVSKTFDADEKLKIVEELGKKLEAKGFKAEVVSFNETGGTAAEEIRRLTWRAILITLVAILAYITLRFNFIFGVGAIAALTHDVLVTLGFFSMFKYEINVPAVAALLTLLGYSLNNTIVIYDRVRENMKRFKGKDIPTLINDSVNQVLRRTINTSLTTFIVVFVLLLFAGNTIKPFAFGLSVGVIVGTYSSIFVAVPLVMRWLRYR
ncbi:MAG: protein translocase subunit SecF [Pseudothermotoga sp.]|uniref:protein translocase subunit SecF n=1 Tax=Pseudothermotoga sp. TaxID=2033661 RepID=UPI00076CAEE5|nr:MAG: Protein-export membrane protein SecF [Thermotoga sp. 50_64]MBC7115413.1 protein translocase subunit SecF [Pseudothermotoga sp.]HCO98798.1 protein translocase subunit SecF [Pseudothermotoga sp.]